LAARFFLAAAFLTAGFFIAQLLHAGKKVQWIASLESGLDIRKAYPCRKNFGSHRLASLWLQVLVGWIKGFVGMPGFGAEVTEVAGIGR